MAKKAPAAAVADDEVEELETEETETEAPAKPALTFGVSNGLIPLLKEKTGKDYTPREVRTLLRKLARQENPVVAREVVAGNKTRYEWPLGAADPEIKAVIKMVKGGAIEQAKTEALNKLKTDKAAKNAAKAAEAAKADKKAGKAAAAAPAPDEDEDEDDDD